MLSTLYATAHGIPHMPNLRTKVIIDVAMSATILVCLVTGLVIWLLLPEGQQSGRYVLWGLAKYQWGDVHTYVSLVFAVALVAHLVVNARLFWDMIKLSLKMSRVTCGP